MTRSAIILMVGSVVLSAPAAAQIVFEQPTTAQPAAGSAQANAENKMICEKQEEIGSRLGGKKVCKTALQWQQEREQQRRTLEDTQRQATSTGTPSG